MTMRLSFPRQRFVKLGALVDAQLGRANATIGALSTRRFRLERALIEAQREGLSIDADLTAAIEGVGAEVESLEARIGELEPAELDAWLAQTALLASDLTYLEGALSDATGAASMRNLGLLIGGALFVSGSLAAIAYFAKKARRR